MITENRKKRIQEKRKREINFRAKPQKTTKSKKAQTTGEYTQKEEKEKKRTQIIIQTTNKNRAFLTNKTPTQ